jgi:hypothetical protein
MGYVTSESAPADFDAPHWHAQAQFEDACAFNKDCKAPLARGHWHCQWQPDSEKSLTGRACHSESG